MPVSARLCIMPLLGAALAACAPGAQETERLSIACQLSKCACASRDVATLFDDPKPVLWNADGTAYCPEGSWLVQQDAK